MEIPFWEAKVKDLHRFYLTMPEIDYLIEFCQTPRDRVILRLLSRTGVRVSELLAISREDIDWAGAILIHAEKTRGKRVRRLVPVDQVSLAWVRVLRPGPGLLFDITRQRVDQIIKGVAERAELGHLLDFYSGRRTRLHPHTFRHSFAMEWLRSKGQNSILELHDLLGNQDLQTTLAYLRAFTLPKS